ncbi:MAG TPA: hypothetical protein VNN73_10985, partial [Blastocatellia bacterium]|nr:hypothetical protein [Blastocatellia bacterium]
NRSAGGALLFDQLNQDQTVGIIYSENDNRRTAGLRVWDRPDKPIWEVAEQLEAIRKMKDGPEKTEAMKRLQDAAARGEMGAQRVFVGKGADKSAAIMLADSKGRTRISLTVDEAGAARLNFLDESGKVIYSLPEEAKKR